MVLAFGGAGQVTTEASNLLVNPGFETPEMTRPWDDPETEFGRWCGNVASTVGPEKGIAPVNGNGMLSFLGTTPHGGGGMSSDVGQQVDVSAYSAAIDNGLVVTHASAVFNRVHVNDSTDTKFGLLIRAFDGPTHGTLRDEMIGEGESTFLSDADPLTWEPLETSLVLPPTTDRIAVMVIACENKSPSSSPEFHGHYADDVCLTLDVIPEPSTLILLSMGAVGLLAYAWRKRRRR